MPVLRKYDGETRARAVRLYVLEDARGVLATRSITSAAMVTNRHRR